jgi:hypothetical protein
MTISISIPSTDEHKSLAAAIGRVLIEYAEGEQPVDLTSKETAPNPVVTTTPPQGTFTPVTETKVEQLTEEELAEDKVIEQIANDASNVFGKVELDANGCPWDERINTSNKGQTAKGVWKRKPGLDSNFYNEIVASIKQPVDDTPPPPAQAENDTPPPPPPQVETSDEGTLPFSELFKLATTAINGGVVTMDQLNEYAKEFECDQFIMVGSLTEDKRDQVCYKIAKRANLV